jgi:hypothetical protein
MPRRPRGLRWTRIVVLVAVNAVVTLAACEGVLRVAERYSRGARRLLFMREDATGIRYEEIGTLRELVNAAPLSLPPYTSVFGYVLNSNGLRTPEYRAVKVPGTRRIVLVGDSCLAENCGVPDEMHVATVLGRELARRGRAEVINLAVSGTGPRFYARMLEVEASRLHPDLVVVGFFVGNDFTDEPEKLEWFPEDVRRAARWRVVRLVRNLRRLSEWRAWATSGGRRGFVLFGGRSRGGFYEGYPGGWPPAPGLDEAQFASVCAGRGFLYADRWPPWLYEHWNYVQGYVRRMRVAAAAGGFPLLAIVIPDVIQVSPGPGRAVRAAWAEHHPDLDRPSRLMCDLCRREGIPVLDLTPAFRERAARGEILYMPGEIDWGPEGQRIAAEAIARAAEVSWSR